MIDGWVISCEIPLSRMSLNLTDDKSTLVQVMAWCRQATSHYLSQCWPRSMPPYGVARTHWVNTIIPNSDWRTCKSHCYVIYVGKTLSNRSSNRSVVGFRELLNGVISLIRVISNHTYPRKLQIKPCSCTVISAFTDYLVPLSAKASVEKWRPQLDTIFTRGRHLKWNQRVVG